MSDAVLMLQQGLGVAVLLAVPLAIAAVVGSVLASLVSHLTGVVDPMLAGIFRTVAVVVAAVLLAETASAEVRTLARTGLEAVADVDHGKERVGPLP